MKTDRLTREDIRQWVNNDEGLYSWWKSSRLSLPKFITANRPELEACINRVIYGIRPAHYLKYGS